MGDRRSKEELRAFLQLTPYEGRPGVALMMCGGEGFGNIHDVATEIGDRLAQDGFGQLVVICGRNEEVRLELNAWNSSRAENVREQVKILGFVMNVDEYMGAADMLITKAGPGSIAEAMIK